MEGGLHEAIREQRRAVTSQLARVRSELRAAERVSAARTARDQQVWQLGCKLRRRVCLAYALAGYRPDAAMVLLAQHARREGWSAKGEDELKRLVEDLRCVQLF